MSHARIILYIPDLAGALRREHAARQPLLEKFFSRAESRQVSHEAAMLAECFGLNPEALASAPLERFAGTGRRNEACWWRADPVHLTADRDQLLMLPQAALAVTGDEARKLTETFNQNYAAEGFVLETPRPDCWYLRVPADWRCRTWNPVLVEGQAVAEFMPSGPDENPVRKLMTEIQMLFHEHPVNQTRESVGKPTVNSLWLWGGGRLPANVAQAPVRIITNLPLIRGLTRLAGRDSESWPAELNAPHPDGDWLIGLSVADCGGDEKRLEKELIKPVWQRLWSGRLTEVACYPGGNRVFILTRKAARRFWRRSQPLAELLSESHDQPSH